MLKTDVEEDSFSTSKLSNSFFTRTWNKHNGKVDTSWDRDEFKKKWSTTLSENSNNNMSENDENAGNKEYKEYKRCDGNRGLKKDTSSIRDLWIPHDEGDVVLPPTSKRLNAPTCTSMHKSKKVEPTPEKRTYGSRCVVPKCERGDKDSPLKTARLARPIPKRKTAAAGYGYGYGGSPRKSSLLKNKVGKSSFFAAPSPLCKKRSSGPPPTSLVLVKSAVPKMILAAPPNSSGPLSMNKKKNSGHLMKCAVPKVTLSASRAYGKGSRLMAPTPRRNLGAKKTQMRVLSPSFKLMNPKAKFKSHMMFAAAAGMEKKNKKKNPRSNAVSPRIGYPRTQSKAVFKGKLPTVDENKSTHNELKSPGPRPQRLPIHSYSVEEEERDEENERNKLIMMSGTGCDRDFFSHFMAPIYDDNRRSLDDSNSMVLSSPECTMSLLPHNAHHPLMKNPVLTYSSPPRPCVSTETTNDMSREQLMRQWAMVTARARAPMCKNTAPAPGLKPIIVPQQEHQHLYSWYHEADYQPSDFEAKTPLYKVPRPSCEAPRPRLSQLDTHPTYHQAPHTHTTLLSHNAVPNTESPFFPTIPTPIGAPRSSHYENTTTSSTTNIASTIASSPTHRPKALARPNGHQRGSPQPKAIASKMPQLQLWTYYKSPPPASRLDVLNCAMAKSIRPRSMVPPIVPLPPWALTQPSRQVEVGGGGGGEYYSSDLISMLQCKAPAPMKKPSNSVIFEYCTPPKKKPFFSSAVNEETITNPLSTDYSPCSSAEHESTEFSRYNDSHESWYSCSSFWSSPSSRGRRRSISFYNTKKRSRSSSYDSCSSFSSSDPSRTSRRPRRTFATRNQARGTRKRWRSLSSNSSSSPSFSRSGKKRSRFQSNPSAWHTHPCRHHPTPTSSDTRESSCDDEESESCDSSSSIGTASTGYYEPPTPLEKSKKLFCQGISAECTPTSHSILYEPPTPLSSFSSTSLDSKFYLSYNPSLEGSEIDDGNDGFESCRSRNSSEAKENDFLKNLRQKRSTFGDGEDEKIWKKMKKSGYMSMSDGEQTDDFEGALRPELLLVPAWGNGNPTIAFGHVYTLQSQILKCEVEKYEASQGIRTGHGQIAKMCKKTEYDSHVMTGMEIQDLFFTFSPEVQERFYPKAYRPEIDYIIRWTEDELLRKAMLVEERRKIGLSLTQAGKEDIECVLRMRLDRLLSEGWICGNKLTLADITVFPYILVLQKMFDNVGVMERLFPMIAHWYYPMLERIPSYSEDKYSRFPNVGPWYSTYP